MKKMKKIGQLLCLNLILLIPFNSFSQEDAVLMTVNNNAVYKSEFEQIYWKNKKELLATKEDLNEYIELFKNFKLKVTAAEELGLDTLTKFINELEGYKSQLTKPYLVDTTTNQELINEAYFRTLNEINASHILVQLSKAPSTDDTLIAYNKINSIRNKIIKEEITFKDAAAKYSEDPSAKNNYGNLGYFGAFRMVYGFESACYKTKTNEISLPFRTKFGYHIVNVHDIRKGRGKMKVAHLMVAVKDTDDNQKKGNSKKKINELYDKINNGESFENLAQEYSDDRQSARKGGELDWIQSSGNYYKEFENTVFSLEEDGEISKPFLTPAGWHIIKRIKHIPLGDLKSLKNELRTKIQKNGRSEISKRTFIKNLKAEYDFIEYASNIDEVLQFINDKNFGRSLVKKNSSSFNKKIFTFSNQKSTQIEFLKHLIKTNKDSNNIKLNFDQFYNRFVSRKIIEHEKTQLESKYPDYKALLKEYRDGILLFEISDEMIWSKAIKDTSGLKSFYDLNKNKWIWPERANVEIFTSNNKKTIKKAYKFSKKGKIKNDSIINLLNEDSQLNLKFEEGKIIISENEYLSTHNWKIDLNKPIELNNKFVFVKIKEFIPSGPKLLEEAEGLITASYQEFLEKQWISQLSEKYKVVIDFNVLHSIQNKPN